MKPTLVSNSSTISLCYGEDEVLVLPKLKPIQKLTLVRLLAKDEDLGLHYAQSFALQHSISNDSGYFVRREKNRLKSDHFDHLMLRRPNHILRQFLAKFDCLKTKSPGLEGQGEWIGVEIECFVPGAERFDELNEAIQMLRIPGVEMHRDGSIHPDDYDEDGEEHEDGSEFTPVEFTIVYNRNNPEPLKRLCQFIADEGGMVNKSCGLHVHLDMRDVYGTGRLGARINRLRKALPILGLMVSESRRHNSYCQLEVSRRNGDRYFAVNLTSLEKHRTIEVRLHSGTTDYTKISNWVELLYSISRQKGLGKATIEFYSDLSEALPNVSKGLMDYVKARILKHNPSIQLYRDKPLTQPRDIATVAREIEEVIASIASTETNFYSRWGASHHTGVDNNSTVTIPSDRIDFYPLVPVNGRVTLHRRTG